MAISQFKFYSSGDAGAPQLNGISGSMLAILDACLVNGYGSKTGLGWIKPFANTASAGAWTQPSGSGLSFCLYDNGAASPAATTECLLQGWENIYAVTGSNINVVGVGNGSFPYYPQMPGSGQGSPASHSFTVRKSGTADTISQFWMMFGDAYTFYFWHWSIERGCYKMMGFGDIFSFSTSPDKYKCIITGECGTGNQDGRWYPWDCMFGATFTAGFSGGLPSWFIARGAGGTGPARYFCPVGDVGKSAQGGPGNWINGNGSDSIRSVLQGYLPCPNIDNAVYVSPLWVGEIANSYVLRGRMRGLYHPCHLANNFSDGQIITGANEYAGKSFQVVKPGYYGGAMLIEISNTVETNDN